MEQTQRSTALGIELGSTRIKAVLIDSAHRVIASGAHDWENRFEGGYWTYTLDDVWAGVQDAYAKLAADFEKKHGGPLREVGALGVSGMMHGYAAMAALRVGMDILLEDEQAALNTLYGHGGLFKTPVVGQKLLAGALGIPVAVMETAGEGGPWGMALLAAYRAYRAPGQTLEEYLAQGVFAGAAGSVEAPTKTDCGGFNAFFARYRACLPAQSAAAKALAAGEG